MDYLLHPNGINGIDGDYLDSTKLPQELFDLSHYKTIDNNYHFLINADDTAKKQKYLGLPFGINPLDIQRARWGIVFPKTTGDDVKEALKPLIEHHQRRIPPDR